MSAGVIVPVLRALWDEHGELSRCVGRGGGNRAHPRTEGAGFASFPQGLTGMTTKLGKPVYSMAPWQ